MPKQLIKKLQIGFGFSFIILLITSIASFLSVRNQINQREKVLHTQNTLLRADRILVDLLNAETGQRGYILTNNEAFLAPFYKGMESLPKSIEQIRNQLEVTSSQSTRIDSISSLVHARLSILGEIVDAKKAGKEIDLSLLEQGKVYMDSCRILIEDLIETESQLLEVRSRAMNVTSNYTSMFILLACFVSLIITFFFYKQIRNEFTAREKLQKELQNKDIQLAKRLATVQRIARKIAEGDYSVRANEDEKDHLGGIAAALNEMTEALQKSFDEISQNEWKQTGLVKINEILTGNKPEIEIATDALAHLIHYGECMNGAFYILENKKLALKSAYGLESTMLKDYQPGEGMVGQVFLDKKIKLLENIAKEDYVVSFANGQIKLANILWLPLTAKGECFGVVELASDTEFEEVDLEFFQDACKLITLEILAAKSRQRIQMLLEETQAQSEELQMQHSELEGLNNDLEEYTQRLQASEEELKVQQEELMQSNQELEERAKLLEEKNQLIAIRNTEIQK